MSEPVIDAAAVRLAGLRRALRHRRIAVVLVLVVGLGVGGYAWADSGASTSYRVATARTGSVEQTLWVNGTVASATRRDLSFGSAGTVSKVLVVQGQKVAKGAVLARLDRTDLDAAVTSARATLARAQAQLVSEQAGTSTAASSQATSTGGSATEHGGEGTATGMSAGTPGGAPGHAGATKAGTAPTLDATALAAAQARLTTDTAHLTTELEDYVAFVQHSCTDAAATVSGGACDPGATTTNCRNGATGPTTLAEARECVGAAQSVVAADATALTTAAAEAAQVYLGAVRSYAADLVTAGTRAARTQARRLLARTRVQAARLLATAKAQAAAARSQTTATTGSGSSAARDQAAVVAARASLTSAQESARSAVLTAPIGGTVVAVDIARGDTVSTSQTAVTVVGRGATTVTGTLSLAQVPRVKVGQRVRVVPAGWDHALPGKLTQVGLNATTDTSGTTTYPVTVTLGGRPSIPLGAGAQMQIVTGSATGVVTVPTSAVTVRSGGAGTVLVLAGATASLTPVTVGLVGTSRTAITSGLKAGQQVVVADLGAALPSGDTSSGTGLGGLAGTRGAVRFSGGSPGAPLGASPGGSAVTR